MAGGYYECFHIACARQHEDVVLGLIWLVVVVVAAVKSKFNRMLECALTRGQQGIVRYPAKYDCSWLC